MSSSTRARSRSLASSLQAECRACGAASGRHNARAREGIIAMSLTQSLSDARMSYGRRRSPAVGGLLSLVTGELFDSTIWVI
jgi:hypothetical protein